MKNDKALFLDEGVKQYSDAKNTIYAFEEAICTELERIIHSRRQWHPLTKTRIQKADGNWKDRGGHYWMGICIRGKSPRHGDALIDCGFWWSVPERLITDGPVVYACFDGQPKRIAEFEWNNQHSGIHSFSRLGSTFLYLPLKDSQTMAHSLNRLLDALLKQLSK